METIEGEYMENNAVIKVVSIQNHDDEERIEVVSSGLFYKEEDIYIAQYEETELSGLGDTLTTFEIGKDYFNLIREGDVNAHMEFKRGHNTSILYNTPHGGLALQVRTKSIKIKVDDKGGVVEVNYDIIVDGQDTINTNLIANINVK
jgi:uncharacterized beta-barrel protein YwiB (DUF1934 family)